MPFISETWCVDVNYLGHGRINVKDCVWPKALLLSFFGPQHAKAVAGRAGYGGCFCGSGPPGPYRPGGTVDTVKGVVKELVELDVKEVAVLVGTNDLVTRDKGAGSKAEKLGSIPEIGERYRSLLGTIKDAGLTPVVMKIPPRKGRQTEIKALNEEVKKVAAEVEVKFHNMRKFGYKHLDVNLQGVGSNKKNTKRTKKKF